mgnify:CR=1 FL=1
MNLSSILKRSASIAVSVALAGGATTAVVQEMGLAWTTPTHTVRVTTTDAPVQATTRAARPVDTDSDRATDRLIRAIKRAGGVPPCKWEDGYGQTGACVWDGATFGNGAGNPDVIAWVPSGVNAQKRPVVLINR